MGQRTLTPRHFGIYLYNLLAVRGVTSERLAGETGLSHDLIEQVLSGRQILTGDLALALGDVFGLSPLVLLEEQRRLYTEARGDEAELLQLTA